MEERAQGVDDVLAEGEGVGEPDCDGGAGAQVGSEGVEGLREEIDVCGGGWGCAVVSGTSGGAVVPGWVEEDEGEGVGG